MFSSTAALARAPGTIGMERRNKPNTGSTSSPVIDFTDGWPPSSVPPEPSSPSPTADFQSKKNSVDNNNSLSSYYNWPPSSNPLPEARVTTAAAALPLAHAPVAGLAATKQLPITTSSFLMPRPVNSWMAQAAAALPGAVAPLAAGNAFPLSAAARQRLETLLDPTLRFISQQLDNPSLATLPPALSQTIPALGRQSQLASPLDAIRPIGAPGILGEHHYVSAVSSLCSIIIVIVLKMHYLPSAVYKGSRQSEVFQGGKH
ncbi:unnamed protein product [Gongylonema pulchrum]|uniref:Uncharacterized protein n=1 Tax=Gongylonema pulchrum TaxID=637853 RepID=A0A183D212_9BILA|nr:unnamed protein product [Gongylonema pulchrum]